MSNISVKYTLYIFTITLYLHYDFIIREENLITLHSYHLDKNALIPFVYL